jgi:hypothetical protein
MHDGLLTVENEVQEARRIEARHEAPFADGVPAANGSESSGFEEPRRK